MTNAQVEIVDAELATVTAAADRVLRVDEDPPWLMHLELQSSRDTSLPVSLHAYNALLERQHGMLVRTVVVLLRRSADGPELTGVLQRAFPAEPAYLVFRYQLLRVWRLPVDTFLSAGLGVLPLAPLSRVTELDLPDVIRRMADRIDREATPEEAGTLWTATEVLMGLRYSGDLVNQLLRGVFRMKESVTYQAIVREGEVKALQAMLLRQGAKRFGAADEMVETTIREIVDVDRLEKLTERLLDASNWQDLLASA